MELRALYTDENIYFLAQWADETLSYQRSPWQKQSDGSWVKLSDPNDLGEDNNLYYEDKAAFIWNINNSIAGFDQLGCLVTCHPGETKPYGNKYTSAAGELGDHWHWKSVRTGPVGQIDDQYLDSTLYNATTAPGAGRKSDPKTGGGYSNNNLVGGVPQYALPDNLPAQLVGHYWLYDSEKVALNDTLYIAGDEVPGIIISPSPGTGVTFLPLICSKTGSGL